MSALFDNIIYEPIYNLLVLLYNIIPGQDFGLAIITLTIVIKLALLPLSKKQIESQKKMQELQPKIKAIQTKYKDDKEKQTRELMEFYKNNKVNPLAGCLPLIIQLIILIAIYRVIINISDADFLISGEVLYNFIHNPGQIKHLFINLVDLAHPSIALAILSAIAQYYQAKIMIKRQEKPAEETKDAAEPDFAQIMTTQMLYIVPAMTLYFGWVFPAGLSLYWFVSTVFMIIQQEYLLKIKNKSA